MECLNVVTHLPYQGKNQEILLRECEKNEYEEPIWGTYLQWSQRGRKVRMDETGTRIFRLVKVKTRKRDKDGNPVFRSATRHFTVFNIEQTVVLN